jgi:DNA polymerase I-like protein with 3'-5' exonuclease and polymerase domains
MSKIGSWILEQEQLMETYKKFDQNPEQNDLNEAYYEYLLLGYRNYFGSLNDLVCSYEGEERYTSPHYKNDIQVHTTASTLQKVLNDVEKIVGHNLIGFDVGVLDRVWNVRISRDHVVDTLYLSRLYNPSQEGGHSLRNWGAILGGTGKIAFEDFDAGLTEEMVRYCIADVELTERVHKWLELQLDKEGFSQQSIDLEHRVGWITTEQERNGFKLDVPYAEKLMMDLMFEMNNIEAELQAIFPPIVEERWSEKTGKQLKDKVTVFNPGSRKQIAERLQGLGVKFDKKTEKGNIIVDEKVLEGIDRPEAKAVARYMMLQKRVAQIDSWLKAVKDDGRVHGRVITNGAVTGRMTHQSPNMAQVPAVSAPFGTECRSCWTVDEGNVLVGIDASGLELRMLAHYMDDEDYTNEILNGDIHTANQRAAGLETRPLAKTFIYAFLYGAGDAKIGAIVGGNSGTGRRLKERFLHNTPALEELRGRIDRQAQSGVLVGLDGRKLRVRSQHAALNTLLQGAGACVMKQAVVHLADKLRNIPHKFVANVHDEWQIETPAHYADTVGRIGVRSIRIAG